MVLKSIAPAAAVLAAFIASEASAQRLGSPAGMVPDFNLETLQPLMNEFGAQTEILNFYGSQTVGVKMPSGAKMLMTPTACNPSTKRCSGVSVRVLFGAENTTPQMVNRFNQQGTVPKAVHEGQAVIIYHYMIADYGMPRGNFDSHIGVVEHATMTYAKGPSGGNGIANSVSLKAEVSHAGTVPLPVGQHAGGFMTLAETPKDYLN